MAIYPTLLFVFASCLGAYAQVINNSIHDKVELRLGDNPILSDTENSTVEKDCINKSLTRKCLVYHNDQWFFFTVPDSGKYYLHITGQECRKELGLQIIIIEGNPCEISTYRIKTCIDRIPQDDVYLPLDSLQAGVQYLVNIDGFLNDFCTFSIRLSTRPEGFHYRMENSDTLDVEWNQPERGVISIHWQVDERMANSLQDFIVYKRRQGDARSTLTHRQPVIKNAYGAPQLTYTVNDTLTEYGAYQFYITGRDTSNAQHILSRHSISYQPERIHRLKKERIVLIPLLNRRRTMMEVFVYDRYKETLLRKFDFFADPRSSDVIAIDLGKYIDDGHIGFLVELVNRKERSVNQYPYRLDESSLPVHE